MFWGCFSYNKKGPCHVWKKETAAEKKAATQYMDKLNMELEPQKKLEWELETGIRRMGLRNKPGKKPQWRFDKSIGKIVRNVGKGGIDWYRYQTIILKKKLIPFALECAKDRPKTVVQEDKAPAHAYYLHAAVFAEAGVERLDWCSNTPDLNAIEPCGPYLKRKISRKGTPSA